MSQSIDLEIVTGDGTIFNDKVNEISLPGKEGVFTVVPSHSSLFTDLISGLIVFSKYKNSNKNIIVIDSGYALIEHNILKIVVDGLVTVKLGDELANSVEKIKILLKNISNADNVINSVYSLESRV